MPEGGHIDVRLFKSLRDVLSVQIGRGFRLVLDRLVVGPQLERTEGLLGRVHRIPWILIGRNGKSEIGGHVRWTVVAQIVVHNDLSVADMHYFLLNGYAGIVPGHKSAGGNGGCQVLFSCQGWRDKTEGGKEKHKPGGWFGIHAIKYGRLGIRPVTT